MKLNILAKRKMIPVFSLIFNFNIHLLFFHQIIFLKNKMLSQIFLLIFSIFHHECKENNTNTCNNQSLNLNEYIYFRVVTLLFTNVTLHQSIFSNFNSFSQLQLACNHTYNTTDTIKFIPNNYLHMDREFHLDKLISRKNLFELDVLVFANLKGINIDYKSLAVSSEWAERKNFILVLTFSYLNIYSNKTLLNDCQSSFNNDHFMTPFASIVFIKGIFC